MTPPYTLQATPPRDAIARLGTIVFADQVLISGTNFAVGLILGRIASASEYGVYTLAFAYLNSVNAMAGSLVESPLVVFGSSRQGALLRSYLGGAIAMRTGISLLVALVTVCAAGVLAGLQPSLAPAFLGLATLIGLDELQEFIRRVLLARLRVVAALLNDATYAIARLAALGGLAFAARQGQAPFLTAQNALLCAALAAGLAVLFGIFQIRSLLAFTATAMRAVVRENWNFGKWGLAGAGLAAVASQVAPWTLVAVHGPSTVGTLGACQTLVFVSNPILNALSSIWGPLSSRAFSMGHYEDLWSETRRYFLTSLLCVGTFTCGLIVAGATLLHHVYGGRYDGHSSTMAYLAIAQLLLGLNAPMIIALNSMRRPDLLFISNAVSCMLAALFSWPAVHHFGLTGFAILQIVVQAITLAIRSRLVLRSTRRNIPAGVRFP